jgi:hypothetical protein
MTKKITNRRAVTSLTMLFAFLILLPSGILLHDSSETSRHLLMALHNTAALVLTITAVIHLYFNWRVIVTYVIEGYKFKKEIIIALAIIVFLFTLPVLHSLH